GHVPEVRGGPENDRVAAAHVVGTGVERALHDDVDALDRVVGGARDDRVGHRLRAPGAGVIDDQQAMGVGHLRVAQSSSTKPERSKVRCSRTSPMCSTTMWRVSNCHWSPLRTNVSRYRPETIGWSGSAAVCWKTTNTERADARPTASSMSTTGFAL